MKFYKKLNKFKIYFLTIFINKLTIYPNINYFLKYIYKTKKIFFYIWEWVICAVALQKL